MIGKRKRERPPDAGLDGRSSEARSAYATEPGVLFGDVVRGLHPHVLLLAGAAQFTGRPDASKYTRASSTCQ
jgi:hypothetical protein